jgi:hypothetical protein
VTTAGRPTLRCPWCRGRFTLPARTRAGGPETLLCPYCGCAADARVGASWQVRAADAVAQRAARLQVRLRRRLWAMGARGLVRPS